MWSYICRWAWIQQWHQTDGVTVCCSQCIPGNMHMFLFVFSCFDTVRSYPYPSGLLHYVPVTVGKPSRIRVYRSYNQHGTVVKHHKIKLNKPDAHTFLDKLYTPLDVCTCYVAHEMVYWWIKGKGYSTRSITLWDFLDDFFLQALHFRWVH